MTRMLNNDCILYIFSFLTPKDWVSVSKVCKQWNYVTNFLWKNSFSINEVEPNHKLYKKSSNTEEISFVQVLEILKHNAPFLKHVSLIEKFIKGNVIYNGPNEVIATFGNYQYDFPNQDLELKLVLKILSEESSNIETLKISITQRILKEKETSSQVLAKQLISVLQSNTNLKIFKGCLNILKICDCKENMPCDHQNLLQEINASIPEDVEQLKITMSNNALSANNVNQILKNRLNLRKLHLCSKMFSDNIMPVLLSYAGHLTSLCLASGEVPPEEVIPNQLNSTNLLDLSKLIHLEKLHLCGHLPVTEDIIRNIVKNCTKIRHVKFSDEFDVTENMLLSIMNLPSLEILTLYCILDLHQFPIHCSANKLHTVDMDLVFNHTFNQDTLCRAIKNMPNLLNLSYAENENYFEDHHGHFFCKHICKNIGTAISRNQDVIILPSRHIHIVSEIEISVPKVGKQNYSEVAKPPFKIYLEADCLDNLVEHRYELVQRFPECEIIVKLNQSYEIVKEDSLSYYSDSDNNFEDEESNYFY